jgi:hypothetical protein
MSTQTVREISPQIRKDLRGLFQNIMEKALDPSKPAGKRIFQAAF